MHLDVRDIAAFYAAPLGQAAARAMRRPLRALWPDVRGLRVAGLGFAGPYLLPFRAEAASCLALMPAAQGCQRWPGRGRSSSALVEEAHLPLPDASIDRLLMVHVLETSETVRPLLREAWRVLSDDGRLLLVVPNRLSLWAQAERTPFGHGHPFTRGQIGRLLGEGLFRPTAFEHGLLMPPVALRAVIASSGALERAGLRLWPHFSGVHVVEAEKDLYAGVPARPARALRAPVLGIARPAQPAPLDDAHGMIRERNALSPERPGGAPASSD
ncbi:MAG: methyltransferase domain-containing protein [Alphaproteobacteria bacterium]|nr:methyltransferase domain-containing protein [Alphaproteobacteria bacterium]